MASLIEELVSVLEQEVIQHKELLSISNRKTDAIVRGDLDGLRTTTDEEQDIVGVVLNLERKREELVNDIAVVINKDPKELTISKIVELLPSNQDGKAKLKELQSNLIEVVKELQKVNDMNKELLNEAAQIVEYTVNYIQSSKLGPETASYTKDTVYGQNKPHSSFDAKQ